MIATTPEVPRTAAPVNKISTNQRGSLDHFYAAHIAAPENQELKEELFGAVSDYVTRSIRKITKDPVITDTPTRDGTNTYCKERFDTDVSQNICVKVFLKLDGFKGNSRFSSWLYRIVENAVIDESNRIKRRGEVELLDIPYGAPNAGHRCSAAGEGPEGPDGNNADDDAVSGNGRTPVFTDRFMHQNEAGLNAFIDAEKTLRRLPIRDQRIVDLYRFGCKAADIATEFGRDSKWASNQLDRLKELLKHEMYVAETILHSCRRSLQPATNLSEGAFFVEDESGSKFTLPICRCRKRLTNFEAKALAKTGEAQLVFKIKNGQPVLLKREVWAPQAVRVPRCGLRANSEAGIQRSYVDRYIPAQLDIEIGHQMSQTELRRLIVPFRPDPWIGRPRFSNFVEERTKGSFEAKTGAKTETRTPILRKMQVQTSKSPVSTVKGLDEADYSFLFGLEHQAFRVSLLANLHKRVGVSAC